MQLFNRYVSTRSLTVFGGEMLLIFGSVALAASLQGGDIEEVLLLHPAASPDKASTRTAAGASPHLRRPGRSADLMCSSLAAGRPGPRGEIAAPGRDRPVS